MRRVVEQLTRSTAALLAEREPGAFVELVDHHGERATEADIAARDWMANEARRLRPDAMFVSEDSNHPEDIEYPDTSGPAEVFLADPCDGSRQFGQLGFGWASCVSYHSFTPDDWWNLDAASVTVSGGKTNSWERAEIVGPGGNNDDSVDLREHTTRTAVRIPPCIAIGASSASGIPLLTDLMHVRDPDVELGTPERDSYLRIWNTAGNPITPGLLRSHTMVAVQLTWSTQWDTLFAYLASTAGLAVYPLVWPPRGGELVDGDLVSLDHFQRRLWWGRPKWLPFERRCIPPLVVGPATEFTSEVAEILRASDHIQRVRPARNEDEQEQFARALDDDIEQLLAAIRRRLRGQG